MTRRQAIQRILAYMESQTDLPEDLQKATDLLRDFLSSMPGKIWDDQKIRQAIERYISISHHTPSVNELDKNPSLPSHPVIQNYYKMTAGEWLLKNYPPSEYDCKVRGPAYKEKYPDVEELLDIFRKEYWRMRPSSSLEYNKKRDINTPTWQYIAKRSGSNTWNELRKKCDIPLRIPRKETSFIVSSFVATTPPLEKELPKVSKESDKRVESRTPKTEETIPSPYIKVKRTVCLKK